MGYEELDEAPPELEAWRPKLPVGVAAVAGTHVVVGGLWIALIASGGGWDNLLLYFVTLATTAGCVLAAWSLAAVDFLRTRDGGAFSALALLTVEIGTVAAFLLL